LDAKAQLGYLQQLDRYTGGKKGRPGRIKQFATQGTQTTQRQGVDPSAAFAYKPLNADVGYKSVSPEQLKALGGAGATREMSADRTYQRLLDQVGADPSMSLYQRDVSRKDATRDLADSRDAISKESEAALTSAALAQAQADQAGRSNQAEFDAGQAAKELAARQGKAGFQQLEADKQYAAGVANNALAKDDLNTLAQMYALGKGQVSQATSSSSSDSANASV
jgi:hypothetical protein